VEDERAEGGRGRRQVQNTPPPCKLYRSTTTPSSVLSPSSLLSGSPSLSPRRSVDHTPYAIQTQLLLLLALLPAPPSIAMPSPRQFSRLLLPILLATCCVDGGNGADAPATARRQLHQPFFVPNQPGQPTAPPPFFPTMPAAVTTPPPPPPAPAGQDQPTYPALVLPNTGGATPPAASSRGSSKSSKLVPAILLPLLTVAVLGLSVAFFFSHRRSNAARGAGGGGCVGGGGGDAKFLHPERTSLFARDEFGGGPAMAPATSAEFLYVGTLASRADERSSDTTSSGDEVSRGGGRGPARAPPAPAAGAPARAGAVEEPRRGLPVVRRRRVLLAARLIDKGDLQLAQDASDGSAGGP
jgi:hypothetical protein